AFGAGISMNNILENNSELAAQGSLIRLLVAALPAAVGVPLCGRAANPGTDRDKDKSPAWCTASILGLMRGRRPSNNLAAGEVRTRRLGLTPMPHRLTARSSSSSQSAGIGASTLA